MVWKLILLTFPYFFYFSNAKFVIERSLVVPDVFTNPGGCYRHATCTNLGANCYVGSASSSSNITYHCCKCECKKTKPYFYSLFTGCLNSKDVLYGKDGHAKHETCLFTLNSSGEIHTFTKADEMQTELNYSKTSNSSSLLNNPDIWCFPRRIYFFTRYGKERLAFENSCAEIIGIKMERNNSSGSVSHYLKFESRNFSDWKLQEGKLLKVEIICKNLRKNLTIEASSCLIFRVNGSYNDEDPFVSHHSPKLCPPPPPYIPPPTTAPPPTRKPWRKIALAVGLSLTASVLIVTLAIIAIVCFIKRNKRKESSQHEQGDPAVNNDEQEQLNQPDISSTDENTNQTDVNKDEDEKAEVKVELLPKTSSEKKLNETDAT